MARKTYFVYTTQGFTQDNSGNDVDNLQILDIIDSNEIKTADDAAEYAKSKLLNGDYGDYSSFAVCQASTYVTIRNIKKTNKEKTNEEDA